MAHPFRQILVRGALGTARRLALWQQHLLPVERRDPALADIARWDEGASGRAVETLLFRVLGPMILTGLAYWVAFAVGLAAMMALMRG